MDRDNQLELVRALTKEVLEMAQPENMSTFGEDFAAFAVSGGLLRAEESLSHLRPRERPLDTTLVAGMFFQVILEAEKLPAGTEERVAFIRRRAKNYLATRLAGQIPLSQFFRLLSLIEANVQQYFEHSRERWLGPKAPGAPGSPPGSRLTASWSEALAHALGELPLIPKGRRKLTPSSLEDFLQHTQGEWFRLLDFEERFRVNKKTAWAYLNQLLQAGILEHNGEKANKVRYSVAGRFRR